MDLSGAEIREGLSLAKGCFEGPVSLIGAKVTGAALLNRATFKEVVDLAGASFGSNLAMSGSIFEGSVRLNSARVAGAAFLDGATFEEVVDLRSASFGSNLAMSGSTFEGSVRLNSAKLAGAAFLDGATFKVLDLIGVSVGSTLDLSDSDFADTVNLTGATISGEFQLGSANQKPPRWGEHASLVLRNARCATLQDQWSVAGEAWPQNLYLEGFAYERLGGLGSGISEMRMLARPTSSYVEILRRDPTASPQPYEYLAQVFRTAGEPGKANEILYQARERQRASLLREPSDSTGESRLDRMCNWIGRHLRWLGLLILSKTIGYGLGLRYFYILFWVLVFTLVGMLLLGCFGNQEEKRVVPLFFVSLDALLPIVTLDPAYEAVLTGGKTPQPLWLQVYFHTHKLLSWAIGSFLVAALAGLTQRS